MTNFRIDLDNLSRNTEFEARKNCQRYIRAQVCMILKLEKRRKDIKGELKRLQCGVVEDYWQ